MGIALMRFGKPTRGYLAGNNNPTSNHGKIKMNHTARLLTTCVLLLCSLAQGQEDQGAEQKRISSEGSIKQVTLYRDQARVTRHIEVPAGNGLRVIEVAQLPENVLPESVFAEGDSQTSVRAVRVSNQPLAQSNRDEIRVLESELEPIQERRGELQNQLKVNQANQQSLEQLITFSAAHGKSDLNKGVLDAKSLTELSSFSMAKRQELSAEQFQLRGQIKGLDEKIRILEKKKDALSDGSQQLAYQATIFVETNDGGAGVVRLNYTVTHCGWSPQYVIRGRVDKPTVEINYSALVQQLSGEDWNGVDLRLSTASPSVNASRPMLTPFRVTVDHPSRIEKEDDDEEPFIVSDSTSVDGDAMTKLLKQLRVLQSDAEVRGSVEMTNDDSTQRDLGLNLLAGQMQQIEMLAAAKSWRTVAQDVADDLTSESYTLKQPVSLKTLRQQQLVQIFDLNLDAKMYHVATPLLSSYAYRESQMTNTGTSLLSGPASIYLDDQFVGKTEIPSTANGQRLTIGFGADSQVRTRRELMDKQDDVQGGNRKLQFTYRLVINNFKDQPIELRLIDRIPVTREQQQLSVSLDVSKQPLTEDPLYNRIGRPQGVLRWDLTVPANQHGSKAFDVQYGFSAEFDRSHVMSAADMLLEMKNDYRDNFSGGGGLGGGGLGGGGMF